MQSTTPILQVFEHQSIKVKELVNGVEFTKPMWEALAKYHTQHQGKYYQLIFQGIQFKQYVGIIQIGELVIEILPKIDRSIDSTHTWQKVLIDMLQYCQVLRPESAGVGQVRLTSHAILDLFFNLFLEEVQQLIRTGLLKKYIPKEQNNHQLKGQLVLPKHLRYNLGNPERFYTRQQVFAEAHVFNQLLQEALKVLQQLSLSARLKEKLHQLLLQFPTLPPYQWQEQDFELLLNHPDYRSHHTLVELTRLILLNFNTDIRYGRHHLFALLFDMNALFEEYIFRQLQREAGATLKVSRQRSLPFWRRRSIRPDIVVETQQGRYIIDTKWKVLPTASPSIEDLKQLYIYCRYFKATKGILLYPSAHQQTPSPPQPFLDEEQAISGQLLFVNVLDDNGGLKKGLGRELLYCLANT